VVTVVAVADVVIVQERIASFKLFRAKSVTAWAFAEITLDIILVAATIKG